MKMKEALGNSSIRDFARGGLMLILIAALTLEATSIIQFYFSQKGIKEEARLRAESEMEATQLKILDVVRVIVFHLWLKRERWLRNLAAESFNSV